MIGSAATIVALLRPDTRSLASLWPGGYPLLGIAVLAPKAPGALGKGAERGMPEAHDSRQGKMIDSNNIDLDNFDLSTLAELPNSLRAAIERVRAELAGDGEQAAFFESSLRNVRKTEGR
jgi:hypothetical protein